ncbi:MAG: FecR domain-containing protein, partial [Gammaproteobacteria bacterium]|nr:FecR domain-containing protein [Gammaproteobacteria bacterium]
MTATSMRRIKAAHAFAWLAALAAPLTAIAAERGASAHVEVATGVVSVVRPDNSASLVGVGYALQPGEAVRTERDSTARLRFSDGTDVVLRPSSQIRIDDYRFDRAQPQSDSFALRLLKGGLRTITGAIAQRNRERVSYGTPTVTIGVRGTDFVMRWCEDDCAREERVAGAMRLPEAAVARLGAMSGGVSALRPDGRWRALDAGDAIYADDAIVTGAAGVAVLFFLDDTRITLQSRSILVIDDYFYDAAAPSRNRVVLALLDGAARTQTGTIAKTSPERFVFLTPERRIRVHGTLFDTVVQVVTGAAETAGEQAGQAAQQTADATKKAADKTADAGQQAAQETTVALQNTNTKISQGQQAASAAGAKATQAANDAISNPPAVETTPTPSGGPTGKIPVPTADVDIGQAAREVGGSVARGAQQAGDTAKQVVEAGSSTAAENWRGTTGAVSDAAGTVRDTSTRVVERVVTWTGGKISATADAGVAAGEATAGAGARTVDYVYDAAGRVVAIGRGVADSATAATRDAVGAAAAATEHALAVVIPAIIGVAKDATDSSAGTAVRDGIGTAAAATDRAVAVVVPAVTDVIKEVKDQTGADGRGSGTIATPPGTGDRVAGRSFETAAGTLPTARTGGDGTGASGALAAGAGSGGKVVTGDTGLTGGEKTLPVAPARTAPFTGETAQQGASTAGKEGTGDAARARAGGEKIAPASPARTAPFSGETARPDAAAGGKEGTNGVARQDGGGSKALPTSPPATSQAASDTARQDSAATSAARGTAVGAGGGVSITAVQVHEGAVTVADSTGELAVRRGSLVVATDAGPMKARFDGVVASTAPNPASFVVDGRLFGAAAGDAPAAGLYTLVRSGRIAMTRDGREVVLDPGEAGYANDAGGAPTRLREIPRFIDADRYLAIAFDPSSLM